VNSANKKNSESTESFQKATFVKKKKVNCTLVKHLLLLTTVK
jgi:hypothetical protein